MTSIFDRWEKDPLFSAAEEVQESTDRMESAYRRWIHARKTKSASQELLSELQTTLGTAKWQLEEFERAAAAAASSYVNCAADDSSTRRRQFIAAIKNQVLEIESSLRDSVAAEGNAVLPWVLLDEGERDELALFLAGESANLDRSCQNSARKDECGGKSVRSCDLVELGLQEKTGEKPDGHRRTASADPNIGSWKITVADEEPERCPPRNLSFSNLIRSVELKSKFNWPKNGFRKWKGGERSSDADAELLLSHQLNRGINTCYERNNGCLDSCDESYDKQLDGWLGAFQRQIQRSQYQIQYNRPIQMTFWAILVFCFIVIFVVWTV